MKTHGWCGLDYKISATTLLYGRAQRDISLVNAPNGSSLPEDKLQTINHPANYLLALEHTFTPQLFNETKVYINRAPYHNPQASALTYGVSTANFVGLNNNTADIEVGTTYGVVDNMTWTHGRHAFKAGMEIRRVRLNQGQTADNVLTFSSPDDMANALLSNITYIAPWCCHGLRRTFYMPYFQDEWKVTPTLTLTAGLRWEYYGVAHEATNRTTVFDLNQFHGVCLGAGSFNTYPVPTRLGADQYSALPCESIVVRTELQEHRSPDCRGLGSRRSSRQNCVSRGFWHLPRSSPERRLERGPGERHVSRKGEPADSAGSRL